MSGPEPHEVAHYDQADATNQGLLAKLVEQYRRTAATAGPVETTQVLETSFGLVTNHGRIVSMLVAAVARIAELEDRAGGGHP